jgi:hypothetical protein
MADGTQDYVMGQLGGIAKMIQDAMDPRTQMALQQARRESELHPLRQRALGADISLTDARALTEGAQPRLYGAQAGDQEFRTGIRRRLFDGAGLPPAMPQELPDMAPLIDKATADFNSAISATPGAAAALGMPTGGMGPNPLLPLPNAQREVAPMSPAQMALLAGLTQENVNPSTFMDAQSKARAMSGPMTEEESRGIMLGQGIAPTLSTAVTPQYQTSIISDDAANERAMNDADNVALRERTMIQQEGAAARAIAAARNGGGNDRVSYSDQRNMQEDADRLADQFFRITRDENGNPTDPLVDPSVNAQAQALARRTRLYIQNQKMDPRGAMIQAAKDIFGSANPTDATSFNQPQSGMFVRDQPFSAKRINNDALGDVPRASSPELNGPSTASDAMNLERLGVATESAPTVIPMLPGKAPTLNNPFAMRLTNDEVKQRNVNQAKVAELRQRVAQIESELKAGKRTINPLPAAMNMGGFGGSMPQTPTEVDLAGDNDAWNRQVALRNSLLQEITKLEGMTGNAASPDDVMRRYAP